MSEARTYVDLSLELRDLDAQTDTFEVALLPAPAVGDLQPERVPFAMQDLQYALEDLDRKKIDRDDLLKLGELLAARLFPGHIRDALTRAIQDSKDGIRLRLIIRQPKLAQLPWEYAYLPIHKGDRDLIHFLVLNPDVSLVRHEPLEERYPELADAASDRLRMVIAMASPAPYRKLKLEKERQVIEDALRDFEVEGVSLDWEPVVEDATEDDLIKALVNGADAFHFAGHGDFRDVDIDEKTGEVVGEGVIALEGPVAGGAPRLLPSPDLALRLHQAGVRLAVLGACRSGGRDAASAWTGIAPALIEQGVAAVVAMQYEVLDNQASAFMKRFYSALAVGLSVDEAVSAGRIEMKASADTGEYEWGVPVLYLRSTDGVLFPRLAQRETDAIAQARTSIRQRVDRIGRTGEVVGIRSDEGAEALRGASISVEQTAGDVDGSMTGVVLGKPTPRPRPREEEEDETDANRG